ncbi:hypothetical protein ACWC9T_17810 [Kitasatospora sp. NPDC001159]
MNPRFPGAPYAFDLPVRPRSSRPWSEPSPWAWEYSQAARANQTWLLREGSFALQRTAGTADETCIDVDSDRDTGDNVFLYTCGAADSNQEFVVENGYITVRETL